MKATLKNLKKLQSKRAFMLCLLCGAEYSADYSDYFFHYSKNDNPTFKCCNETMVIAEKETIIKEL